MNNLQFVAFCRAALELPSVYGWGMWGKLLTDAMIDAKAAQYPVRYDRKRVEYLRTLSGKAVGCDCTGLIKWFLWTDGDINKVPKYNSATDKSASGWYRAASVRGDFDTMPERLGLIVSKAGHCGVYIGGGRVIECTRGARGDGVVESALGAEKWEKWCECPYIEYSQDMSIDPPYRFENGGKRADTYCDAALKDRIGSLDPSESCGCFGLVGRAAAVYYDTAGGKKIGFVAAASGTISAL